MRSAAAAVQTVQVLGHAEGLAAVYRHDFIDAVAEDEAPVQHGDPGLVDTQEITIEINRLSPCTPGIMKPQEYELNRAARALENGAPKGNARSSTPPAAARKQ